MASDQKPAKFDSRRYRGRAAYRYRRHIIEQPVNGRWEVYRAAGGGTGRNTPPLTVEDTQKDAVDYVDDMMDIRAGGESSPADVS